MSVIDNGLMASTLLRDNQDLGEYFVQIPKSLV